MAIYSPAEDSYFFSDFLRKYLKKNKLKTYLDMGTGSGILSETVSKFVKKENITAVDIDKESCELVRKKGFKVIQSNLFSKINDYKDNLELENSKIKGGVTNINNNVDIDKWSNEYNNGLDLMYDNLKNHKKNTTKYRKYTNTYNKKISQYNKTKKNKSI